MRLSLPSDWQDRYVVAMYARAFGPCETDGANRGFIPDYLVGVNGFELGEYWCMDAVGATGRHTFRKAWPMLRSGSCQQQREDAQLKGAILTRSEFDEMFRRDPLSVRGLIFLCINAENHAHHTGTIGVLADDGSTIVKGPNGGWLTVEGNASNPAKPASRNGDGWYAGRERGSASDKTTYLFIDISRYRL